MSRYRADNPPLAEQTTLTEYLFRELRRIQESLDDLYDGLQDPIRELPEKQDPVVAYSDGEFDLGDGEGLYLRIDGQWYKLQMTPVAALRPSHGNIQAFGQTPTVS